MAVRITRDERAYETAKSQFHQFRRGQVVGGPLAVWLLASNPDICEALGAPNPAVAEPAAPEPAAVEPEVQAPNEGATTPAESAPAESGYDPAEHSVAQVLAYVKEHPDEAEAIRSAEAGEDGKRRTVILSTLRAPR